MNKIAEYILLLKRNGTRIGYPVVRPIEGDVWELRPLKNRIFFFYWKENKFVLLSHYMKQSQKAPKREIEKAKANMRDWLEREGK